MCDKMAISAYILKIVENDPFLTLISMGGWGRHYGLPIVYSSISPERLELRPSNFLTFSFYLLAVRKI